MAQKMQTQKPIGVLINPSSGSGHGGKVAHEVWQALAAAQVPTIDLAGGSYQTDLVNARKAITDESIRALMVVGGDGMVHLGVNVCASTEIPLAIIPAGTGNDAAVTLGLPIANVADAVTVALQNLESPRRVDLLRGRAYLGDFFAFGVVSAGFDALVNARANKIRFPKGPARYRVALLLELFKFRGIKYKAVIDGRPRQIDAMLCAVANAPRFGAGMLIAPHASVDSAQLELFIVHKISRLELLRVFPSVYTGGHVNHPAVEFVSAQEVTLDSGNRPVFADGEYVGDTPVTVAIAPGALLVAAPPMGIAASGS